MAAAVEGLRGQPAGRDARLGADRHAEVSFVLLEEDAQDHAAYAMCSQAAQVLGEMGITLTIKDVNERVWRNTLSSNNAMMWAGSWKNSFDLNMTQVYHSQNTRCQFYSVVNRNSCTYSPEV